jgi:ferric-dicitrate binding protein FerR (iron transport regulator)
LVLAEKALVQLNLAVQIRVDEMVQYLLLELSKGEVMVMADSDQQTLLVHVKQYD